MTVEHAGAVASETTQIRTYRSRTSDLDQAAQAAGG